MPDLSEVESALVALVAQAVYPLGTAAPSATGDACKVFRGWPIPAGLDADLRAGTVNISVFPMDGEQNVTRYTQEWVEPPSPRVTLTAAAQGSAVTFAGRPCCPVNVAVIADGKPFVYPVQATDTLTSIATALASLVGSQRAASSSGPVLTVPGTRSLVARVGAVGDVVQEVKRQKKGFKISAWCHDPLARDRVAAVIDPALAALTFISLPDGTSGRIRYERTHVIDAHQKAGIYRRDFQYSVEYATTASRKAAAVVADIVNVTGNAGAIPPTNA